MHQPTIDAILRGHTGRTTENRQTHNHITATKLILQHHRLHVPYTRDFTWPYRNNLIEFNRLQRNFPICSFVRICGSRFRSVLRSIENRLEDNKS